MAVIVRLIGGLGNQLFQYATGRRLAHERNILLKLDISGFSEYKLRAYALEPFSIQATIATEEDLAEYRARQPRTRFGKMFQSFNRFGSGRVYKEPTFRFDPSVLKVQAPVLLDGYWQSENYFSAISPIIQTDLTIRAPLLGKNLDMAVEISRCEAVSIHVRRGDYATNAGTMATHGLCSLDYYERALRLIKAKVREPVFFVFSDDPDWVRRNLLPRFKMVVIDYNSGNSDYEDLRLMTRCRHHILANSTFSWWGAWLNSRPDKIVIAPARWFRSQEHDDRDLIPKGWLRI